MSESDLSAHNDGFKDTEANLVKRFPTVRYHLGALGLATSGGFMTATERPLVGFAFMGGAVIAESLAVAKHSHRLEAMYNLKRPGPVANNE